MMPRPTFPRYIAPDAAADELADFLSDLLDWLVQVHRPALRDAGFLDADLFTLRRIAAAYRAGNVSPETFRQLQEVLAKLESMELRV